MLVTFNLFTTNIYANDGVTPAEETTCDELKADGITKGLYGLCVAYCEAQDIFDETVPVTEEEALAIIEDSMPSEKILRNYDRRKKDTDPEMPCIVKVVDAICPCWDNLDSIVYSASTNQSCTKRTDFIRITEGIRRGDYASLRPDILFCSSTINRISKKISNLTNAESESCKTQILAACDSLGL